LDRIFGFYGFSVLSRWERLIFIYKLVHFPGAVQGLLLLGLSWRLQAGCRRWI